MLYVKAIKRDYQNKGFVIFILKLTKYLFSGNRAKRNLLEREEDIH